MLNKKGMLAKLFSAVLAAGMVIQPVTPLTSPIIVFAEGEGGTTETPTGPEPSSPSTPGDYDPGDDGGNQTPGTGNQGSGNTGTGDQGDGQQGGSGESGESGGTGEPEQQAKYNLTYEVSGNTVTITKDGETASEIIKVVLKVTNSDKTDGDVELLFREASEVSHTFKKTVPNTEVSYTLTGIEVWTETGPISEGVTIKNYDDTPVAFTIGKETVTFDTSSNDVLKATVTNPADGVEYKLVISDESGITHESDPASNLTGEELSLEINTKELNLTGTFSAKVTAGNNGGSVDVDEVQTGIVYDHTSPVMQSFTVNDTEDKITFVLDENVDPADLAITFDAEYSSYSVNNPVEPILSNETPRVFTYTYKLSDLSGGENGDHAGTKYTIDPEKFKALADAKGNKVSISNEVLAQIAGEVFVDTSAPAFDENDVRFIDLPENGYTNKSVTVSVTFAEGKLPEGGNVTLTYHEGDDTASPISVPMEVSGEEKVSYEYTFAVTTGSERNIVVESINATDGRNASKVDIGKSFVIDTIVPEVTVSLNDKGLNQWDIYYSNDPSITFTSNEPLTISLKYNDKTDEKVELTDPDLDGQYEGTFADFNTPELSTVEYKDFSFAGSDVAGNDINFSGDIDNFVVDKTAPTICDEKFSAYDAQGKLIEGEDVSSANGNAVYSFTIKDDASGINDTAFSLTDLEGNTIEFISKEDENNPGTYNFTVNAPLNINGVIVTAKDNVGNSKPYTFKKPLILEADAPVVTIGNKDKLNGIANSFTVEYSVTDGPEGFSSGVKDVTYFLTRTGSNEHEYFSNVAGGSAALKEYTVYDANGSIFITSSKNENIESLNGNYTLHIVATDKATNVSDEETVNLSFDSNGPDIILEGSKPGEKVINNSHSFDITANEVAINEVSAGFDRIEYYLTEIKNGVDTNTKIPFNNGLSTGQDFKSDASKLTISVISTEETHLNGEYALHVIAYDKAGNFKTEEFKRTYDNGNPIVEIKDEATNGTNPSQDHTVVFDVSDPEVDGVSTGVPAYTYYLTKDGSEDKKEEFISNDGTAKTEFTVSVENKSNIVIKPSEDNGLDGIYTLHIVIEDAAGNSAEDTVQLYFDNTAPVITIDKVATDGDTPSLKHDVVITSIVDGPSECPSGVNVTKFWLTEKGSTDKKYFSINEDGSNAGDEFTYTSEASDLRGNIIVTSSNSEEHGKLNGIYTLHIVSTDDATNTSVDTEETSVDLYFDTEAPVTTINVEATSGNIPEQSHVVTIDSIDDGPEEISSTIKSVTYWLTKKGSDEHEEFSNNIDPLGTDYPYPASGYAGGEIYVGSPENGEQLNGIYTFYISAVDNNGNSSTVPVDLYFDNTPATVKFEVANEDVSTKKHDVKLIIADYPEDTASGIDVVKYWLTDDDAEDPEAHVKFNNGTEERDEFIFEIPADQVEDETIEKLFSVIPTTDVELNGVYTLHVNVLDKANNELVDESTPLQFDNTSPELSDLKIDNVVPEEHDALQSHTVSFNISDGPENYSSEIATVKYWLTKKGSEKKEAFDTTLGEFNEEEENVAVVKADLLGEVTNPNNANLDNKSFEATIKSPSSGEKLNGEYDLHIVLTDKAGNINEIDPVESIRFDTQPLDVSITYVPGEGATYRTEDNTIFTNSNPTIKVSVTDNYLDELEVDNLKLQWLTNGTEHELEKSEFTLNADKSAYELEFVVGESISDEDLEKIRNTFVYSGSDHAGNGANVTIDYGTDSIDDQVVSINGDAKASVETTTPLVVDKVAPKYVIDLGTSGKTHEDSDDVVNKEYFGSAIAEDLKPTVTFTEENFNPSAFEVATVSDTTGETQYEKVTFDSIPDAEWHGIGSPLDEENKVYSVIRSEDLDNTNALPDGVYRFAVKGTDKAGNALVQSNAEEGKLGADASSMVTKGTYWTGYKIVDTQLSVNLQIKKDAGSTAYLTYTNKNGQENVALENGRSIFRKETGAYVVADAVDEMSQYRIEFSIDSTTQSGLSFAQDRFGRDNLNTGSSIQDDQRFNIAEGGYIVDRADNRLNFKQVIGNYIYLDDTVPEEDPIKPVASIQATATSDITARTPNRQDLYSGDVRLEFSITDPNQSEAEPTSSGLKEVHYIVRADGKKVDDNSYDINDFGNATTYNWSGYTVVGADTNNIQVEFWGVDNSGNESNHATYEFGIDKTAPVITIAYDNNDASHDKYFKENRTATVTIQDRNIDFNKITVETSVDHSGLSAATQNGSDNVGNNDTRTFTIPYTQDGDYTLDIHGTDAVGNVARVEYVGTATQDFTIDKTTPVINVSFNNNDVRNGKYYNAGRVATVTIDEHNFLADEVNIEQTASIQRGSTGTPAPSGFGTNGDSHSASINYSADGNYTLRVNYTDMAGNVAQEVVVDEFTIDTTKPVVRFDENTVTDNMATNGVIAPSVIFDDTNFDANGISVTLTGARVDNHNHPFTRTVTQFGSVVTFSDFARVKESDDIYTAKATITDLAGNTAEATVRFSVNRFGSTFDFNDDENTMDLVDSYYAQETGNVIIREVNVNKLTGYTLTVNRDGSNVTLVEGEDFRVISSAIAGGYQYIYEIFPDVFGSEGTYSIIVQSVDEAGNTNTNSTVRTDDGVNDYPVVFAIDKTLPTVSIDELDPDDRSNNNFNENTKTFRVSVRDNNALARVIVTVDGNVVFDMDGQELAEYLEEHGGFVEITLDAAGGYQTIKVQAFDGAGNESADTQYQVLVTTNFFVRFYYNKPLFYGSIILLILLLLAIAYYIKKRMDKQKKNA